MNHGNKSKKKTVKINTFSQKLIVCTLQHKCRTHRRRTILIALSWASLFEDKPLFASCCLRISDSTLKAEYLLINALHAHFANSFIEVTWMHKVETQTHKFMMLQHPLT